jgi:hypothetical protein
MKIHLLPVALLLFINTSTAQDTEFKYAVKLYNLSTIERTAHVRGYPGPLSQRNTVERVSFLHPTIAFQWRANNNHFHELELTNFKMNQTSTSTELIDTTGQMQQITGGTTINSTHLSARYEYGITCGSIESKLVPAIGLGVETWYRGDNEFPKISTTMTGRYRSAGAAFHVIPRITQELSKRLLLDINIPLRISDAYFRSELTSDPRLPEDQRKVSTLGFDMFPWYFSGRVGLVLKV